MKHTLHIIALATLLLPHQVFSQGKALPRLSQQEDHAYELYQEGRYKEACEIYIHTTQGHNERLTSKVISGLTIFFLVDIIGILFFLYVEKRKAYRLLVDKNTECARRPVINTASINFEETDVADGHDRCILEEVQRLLETEKIYLDGDLTIEQLASRLGTNRNTLSKLVNHHLGRSFPALLNQYRINEAVRMLTNPQSANYTIEAIAQMCGYNNRQVFHSAFKKETGLTPTEFRQVAHSKD